MHGQFVWYELTTPDVDAAQKFYPRFTGWGTQRFDNDYTMFTDRGVPVAGIFRLTDEMRQQGVPPNWMPYIEADDVDGTATRAAALGAKVVVAPTDIPGTGRFAVVQDPQGAVFGVYKSSMASGAWDGTPVIGRFSWHELMTTDAAAAQAFYSALFGWDKSGEMDMGGGNMYYMFGRGAKMYGGIYNRMPEMGGMHPFWLVYVHVKDVGKAVAAATKGGARVQRERMEIPGGTIAILGDPQGAGFALHDVIVPAAAAEPAVKAAVRKAVKTVAKTAAKAAKAVRKTVKKAVRKTVKKAGKKAVKKAGKKAVTKAGKKAVTKAGKKVAKASARPKAKSKAKVARRARPKVKTPTRSGARKVARKKPATKSRRARRGMARRR